MSKISGENLREKKSCDIFSVLHFFLILHIAIAISRKVFKLIIALGVLETLSADRTQ